MSVCCIKPAEVGVWAWMNGATVVKVAFVEPLGTIDASEFDEPLDTIDAACLRDRRRLWRVGIRASPVWSLLSCASDENLVTVFKPLCRL